MKVLSWPDGLNYSMYPFTSCKEGNADKQFSLHPRSMTEEPSSRFNPNNTFEIPALPSNVPIVKVYADMFHWLLEHVERFFESNMVNGGVIWERLGSQLTLVVATPNGWEIQQQQTMRDALILGRVLPPDHDPDRLEFVTEGEASVHYALHHHHHRNGDWLSTGTMFALVDAGGSTVDSTLYRCREAQPDLILEEACSSECVQAGSVFVDRAMQSHLEDRLSDSRFNDPEDIARMVKRFEESTKRRFDGRGTEYYLEFGSTRDTEPRFGISRGRLRLSRNEVEAAFSEAVNEIVLSCSRLLQRGAAQVTLSILIQTAFHSTTNTHSTSFWWAVLASHPISRHDSEKLLVIKKPGLSRSMKPR